MRIVLDLLSLLLVWWSRALLWGIMLFLAYAYFNPTFAATLPVPPVPITHTNASLLEMVADATEKAVSVTDKRNLQLAVDKTVEVNAKRKIPYANLAKGAAKAIGGGLALGAVADLALNLRCKYTGSEWKCDYGKPEEVQSVFQVDCLGEVLTASTPVAAYSACAAKKLADYRSGSTATGHTYSLTGSPSCEFLGLVWACQGYKLKDVLDFPGDGVDPITTETPFGANVTPVDTPFCTEGYVSPHKCYTKEEDWKAASEETVSKDYLEPKITSTNAPDVARDLSKSTDLAPLAGPQSLTGPSSVAGEPRITTETKPDGTTTTTTVNPTYNIRYDSTSITYNTTNTTVNSDGSTKTETPEDEKPVVAPPDPDLGEVPKLYERKYPDGLKGVWLAKQTELNATPIFAFLRGLAPGLADGGCPTWSIPLNNGLFNPGSFDLSVPCYVWSFIRVIMTLFALFVARKMIIGG